MITRKEISEYLARSGGSVKGAMRIARSEGMKFQSKYFMDTAREIQGRQLNTELSERGRKGGKVSGKVRRSKHELSEIINNAKRTYKPGVIKVNNIPLSDTGKLYIIYFKVRAYKWKNGRRYYCGETKLLHHHIYASTLKKKTADELFIELSQVGWETKFKDCGSDLEYKVIIKKYETMGRYA